MRTFNKTIHGATVNFQPTSAGFHINRIEIPKNLRGRRMFRPVIGEFLLYVKARAATRGGSQTVSLNLMPDNVDDTDRLRDVLTDIGFKPLEMDGETYRNDLSITVTTK